MSKTVDRQVVNGQEYLIMDSQARSILIDISGMTAIKMEGTNQYITTNGEVGSVVSYTPSTSTGYKYAIIECEEGDIFTINA